MRCVFRFRWVALLPLFAATVFGTAAWGQFTVRDVGGPAAPDMEMIVMTYAPPAAPVEFPRGRVLSTESEQEKKIRAALAKPGEVDYLDVPLVDVVTDWELRYEIDIELDVEALAADGRGAETKFTAKLRDMTLRDVAERVLGSQGMTYVIKHDVLLITTKAAASQPENTIVRLYEVQDLVVLPNDEAILKPLFESSREAIHSIRAHEWSENGGSIGYAQIFEGPGVLAMLVRHNQAGHRDIERLLDRLRQARNPEIVKMQATKPVVVTRTRIKASVTAPRPFVLDEPWDDGLSSALLATTPFGPPATPSIRNSAEPDEKLRAALQQTAPILFTNTPLGQVADHYAKVLDCQVILDVESLAADGRDETTPITRTVSRASNHNALKLILNGMGLTYLVRHNAILITTKAAASQPENWSTRVYPVQDLVLTPHVGPTSTPDFDSLIELLTSMIHTMDDWSDGGGTISTMQPHVGPGSYSLVVRGSDDYHAEVEEILGLLRKARVQAVFDAQAKRPTLKPTSTEIFPPGKLPDDGSF